jgi:hypothetical protein
MDLTTYVDALRRELVVAAEAGGDEARALAERLVSPLDSATRLALLEALSEAADEITREMAPGSVEVRLRGRDPDFVVTLPPAEPAFADPAAVGPRPEPGAIIDDATVTSGTSSASATPGDDDGGTARITLRLPAHLKPRIEEAASHAALSVNSWLVRAVTAALDGGPWGHGGGPSGPPPGRQQGRRYTGWVR